MFAGATQETGNGLDACDVCDLVDTKPSLVQITKLASEESDDSEVSDLVDEIESLIKYERAGFPEKKELDFHIWKLKTAWIDAERIAKEMRDINTHDMLQAVLQIKR